MVSDVVDHDAAVAQLGLQLRHDVHAVEGHVLERACPIDIVELSADQIHSGDVVQLWRRSLPLPPSLVAAPVVVMQPAIRPRREVIPERHEAGDVLAHR